MSKKVLLFTLETFSATGGIQKMCRALAYSLSQILGKGSCDFELWSVYDKQTDIFSHYLDPSCFRGFGGNRRFFTIRSISMAAKADVFIFSHINLAVIGLIIKIINPACKVWLIAHGIEVWRPLSPIKRFFLRRCDKIVCVSNFTKEQMIVRHQTPPEVCVVLNNMVDPLIKLPIAMVKPAYLRDRYRLNQHQPIIFTLTRLASTEQYKGYERVIEAVSAIKNKYPDIKYILSGKYDVPEQTRIQTLIEHHNLADQVILTGFIPDEELADHFMLADLFVLPSKKEGFGIVFIEAMACGLPVICGNADGSIDAIRGGELGRAVNADDATELQSAIIEQLEKPLTAIERQQLQEKCLSYFSESQYRQRLKTMLTE